MIKIVNKAYETVALLNTEGSSGKNTPYFEDEYYQNLENGSETLTFKTFGGTNASKHLEIGNYIAYTDYDGIIRLFQIINTTETHVEDYIIEVYCEMASIELINEIVRPMKVVNANLKSFLQTILQESAWEIGVFPKEEFHEIIDFEITEYTTIYTCLQEYVIQKYGGELDYRIEFHNNKITKRYIDIYKERGRNYEKLFYYSKNMSSVIKKVDSTNIATALIGVGKDGITFKTVSANDKLLNQDFIENPIAFKKWNVNGSHIMGVYNYDTDSPSELLIMTRRELERRSEPNVTYELSTELLDKNIHLGSYVGVVDHELDMYLKARVTELVTSKTDESKNRCVLSNFREVKSKTTDFTMKDVINNIKDYLGGLDTGALKQSTIDNIKRYLTELKLTKSEIDDIFKKLNLPHYGTEDEDDDEDDFEDKVDDEDTTPAPESPPIEDTTLQNKICEKARELVKQCTDGKAWYSQKFRTYNYRKPNKIQNASESTYLKNHIGKIGYDCSSFVGCCYDYAGFPDLINLSCAGGSLMATLNKREATYWKYTDDKNLTKARAGDIVMFANSSVANVKDLSTLTAWKKTHHTAIYLGNGKVAHARSYTKGIAITDVSTTLNNTCYFARIKDLNVTTTTKPPTTGDVAQIDGTVATLCWNFFIDKGCSKQVTAGIMGNIYRESNMIPNLKSQYSSAYGLFQWLGARLDWLKDFAKKKGTSYTDAMTQLEFAWWEMTEEPYTSGLFKKRYGSIENFIKLTDIEEATYGFLKCFERANETEKGLQKRYAFARDYYNQYSNKPTNVISTIKGTTKTLTLANGKTHTCETLSSLTFNLPNTAVSGFNTKLIFSTPNNTAPMKIKQSPNCWLSGKDCKNGVLIPQPNTRYTIVIKKNTSSSIKAKFAGTVTKVSYSGARYITHSGFKNATKLLELAKSYYDNKSKFKYSTTTPITKYKSGTPKSNRSKWYTGGKNHIDCSTFTNQIFKGRGYKNSIYYDTKYGVGKNTTYSWAIDLGRSASNQAQYCMEQGWYLADIQSKEDWSKLKKGDLVFWSSRSGDSDTVNIIVGRFMQVGHVAVVDEVNGTDVTTYEVSNPDGVILKRKLENNHPNKIIFFARVRK